MSRDKELLERITPFILGEQIARHDYHAPITAGQIGNILMGRGANDDGLDPVTSASSEA